MLIMSNSKKALVNLNKANGIYIDPYDDDRNLGEVYAQFGVTYPEDIATLGVYKMERAMEILQQIADRQGCVSTYEMPEE